MDIWSNKEILFYDDELMDSIAQQYSDGATLIEEIITEVDSICSILETAYDGQAGEYILPDMFSKLKEHLEFLNICYTATSTYVTDCKETMHMIDEAIVEKMSIE